MTSLKTETIQKTIILGIIVLLFACSTKKNTFVGRNYHALTTEYNVLYNGGVALEQGIQQLKTEYKDNFWERLPVERMQILEENDTNSTNKNPNFELAETKAAKAIQKHAMNIEGVEKNPQIDEAHLMLGKARYYQQRFVPALEAFNYVLYKYPNSDKIYEVKIWREKTNMRMENDAQAIINLSRLLKEIKLKDQIFADANATLAQAFLNEKQKDSAVAKLKLATEFTKSNEEKARYKFILGQVYEELGHKDSAATLFKEVIEMKRKSPRRYIIHAQGKLAAQFDFEKGDTLSFLKKYDDLIKDRENRPFLDVLHYQLALFYDKREKPNLAKKEYNASLKSKSEDRYLIASNYRNLADIYFKKTKYVTASKYYDSTLAVLNPRSREFKNITKKRENLEDVIKYEALAQRNDSILKVVSLNKEQQISYYKEYIEKLIKEDEKVKSQQEENRNEDQEQISRKELPSNPNQTAFEERKGSTVPRPQQISNNSDFYFYNTTTVSYGKTQFIKKWGKRKHVDNWRFSTNQQKENTIADNPDLKEEQNDKTTEEKYTTDFYIKQLPTSSKDLDSIAKERNFAYYQLGVIYKEKFKEYKLASDKLETLLNNNPEERLVLSTLYNLFKIYEITNPEKAVTIKNKIIAQYPDSRYAQILSNNSATVSLGSPQQRYTTLYKEYEEGTYRTLLEKTEEAIQQFTEEEILSKFELLRAHTIGKLKGVEEYQKALNFVALTYPNTSEGKEAESHLTNNIPYFQSLYFNSNKTPSSWKIIYEVSNLITQETDHLLKKLNKFAEEQSFKKIKISTDIYTLERTFIVVHGLKSEEGAKAMVEILKETKEYKIATPSIIISTDNYEVVQVFKNIEEYQSGKGPHFEAKEKPAIVIPKEKQPTKQPKIEIPSLKKESNTDQKTTNPFNNLNPSKLPISPEDGAGPPGENRKLSKQQPTKNP